MYDKNKMADSGKMKETMTEASRLCNFKHILLVTKIIVMYTCCELILIIIYFRKFPILRNITPKMSY